MSPEMTRKTLLAPTGNVTPKVGALGVLSSSRLMDRPCGYGPQNGSSILSWSINQLAARGSLTIGRTRPTMRDVLISKN